MTKLRQPRCSGTKILFFMDDSHRSSPCPGCPDCAPQEPNKPERPSEAAKLRDEILHADANMLNNDQINYVLGIVDDHLDAVLREAREEGVAKGFNDISTVHEEALRKAEHALGNLLAVIHGDGGHYIAEHGIEKAAKDAEDVVLQDRRKRDEAEFRLEKLRATQKEGNK